jgi:hypothetical protein
VIGGLLLALLLSGLVFGLGCSGPLDLNDSGPFRSGAAADGFLSATGLAFGAHAAAGWILSEGGCDGTAVGLQWVKAAWHAQTPEQEALAVEGLELAAHLAGGNRRLQADLCPLVGTNLNPSQVRALRRAGLTCEATAYR